MASLNLAVAAHDTHLIWAAAALAWVLAVPLWWVTKFLVVLAHEGGHALVAVALFNGIKRIAFDRGGGGVTEFSNSLLWPFGILVALAGYTGPSLFGLLAAALLVHGQADMVLWASMAFLVVMMFSVRGLIGWIVGPVLLFVFYELATKTTVEQRTLAAYVWTWFLLIGAVQQMLVFLTAKLYLVKAADTHVAQRMTLIPSEIWTVLLLLGTGAALVWGGSMLLHAPT